LSYAGASKCTATTTLYDTPMMNVLVIGSGGREHALGWKLQQSPQCGELFFAPGNGGTATIGRNLEINVDTIDTKTVDEIDYFCRHNQVELIIIGPEDPLSQGLADRLRKLGRTVFGPNQAAARLEADKAFAKQLMRSALIPTAESRIFTDLGAALTYVESRETPVVVKAAGLCKGKGVIVCDDNVQSADAVRSIMGARVFGEAGDTVVIEERLVGQELSVLAIVDGRTILVLDPAQDHKAVGEGDVGPNTGGMGAYTPTPLLMNDQLMDQINRQVLVPAVDALRRDGVEYSGVLYAGLMLTAGGPKVIEFNCRFGDPEIQPLLMRLDADLLEILLAAAQGRLDEVGVTWDQRHCCCVVIASGGYPGSYENGKVITGLDDVADLEDVMVFHAGTKLQGDEVLTNGGRVLSVCALGSDLKQAQQRANAACARIHFEGAFHRHDIGFRALGQA
jgi:phosphoribosylamine--glycine ligase